MEKSVKITGIIAATVLVIAILSYSLFSGLSPMNTVNARGTSTIKVTPDLVTLYYTVETSAETASEAKDQNAEIVEDVILALVMEGFNRDEIQTTNFNVYEDFEWTNNQRVFKGYKATHNLRLELTTGEMDKVGEAIDAGIDAGATLNYINFELSSELENQYKAQALREATEDAKIKAEAIAEGLGSSLGRVVSTSDSSFSYSPWRLYSMEGTMAGNGDIAEDAKLATTNIQPGEQEIFAQVSVTYKLR